MKKTLLVTNDFPPHLGGIETFLEGFSRTLDPQQLIVYTSRRARNGIEKYDASTPWTTYRDPARILLPTPFVAQRMKSIIRKHTVENVWFGASLPLAFLARTAKKAGVHTVIMSTHGDELTWTATFSGRAALRSAFARADAITYISQAMHTKLSPYIPTNTPTIHLPGGIDTEQFTFSPTIRHRMRKEFSMSDTTPIAICVGRLIPGKGQDTLIRAWEYVHAHTPHARLFIVGAGPYEKKIRTLVAHSPAADSITLTGPIEHARVHEYYCMADVFVMPCRERLGGLSVEGLGITYLEAAASSLPVIVGRSGGAPETVIDGHTGYVVNGNDEHDVAERLIELLTHRKHARAMGKNGTQWIQQEWTWDTLAPKLRTLLS